MQADVTEKAIAALEAAAKQFRWYEELHAKKPDMEKAQRNAEMAVTMEEALAALKLTICQTCNGRGTIGGFESMDAGYRDDPCPDCGMRSAELWEIAIQTRVSAGNGFRSIIEDCQREALASVAVKVGGDAKEVATYAERTLNDITIDPFKRPKMVAECIHSYGDTKFAQGIEAAALWLDAKVKEYGSHTPYEIASRFIRALKITDATAKISNKDGV